MWKSVTKFWAIFYQVLYLYVLIVWIEMSGNVRYVVGPRPDGCTLYVPFGCSEAYKASEKWSKFKIEEMPEDKWWEMIP